MKKILIKNISLEGFYGQTRKVYFSPTETVIRGDVKLGKTTILNAFMWCILGVDLEGRANYMLYDQSVRYSHDFAGQARVEIVLSVDGELVTLARSAKQKWVRDKNTDTYVKASSDEYKYYVSDLELTKGEYDEKIEQYFCTLKKLPLIANIDSWKRMQWRTLRENFQSLVGEIKDEDFKNDYSSVLGVIKEAGVVKAREEFQRRATKYERQLDRLQIEEEAIKRDFYSSEVVEQAEKRIEQIHAEIDELDRRHSSVNSENEEAITERERIALSVATKERLYRQESMSYEDAHSKKMQELRQAYNNAVSVNRNNEGMRKSLAESIKSAQDSAKNLDEQVNKLREEYKQANAKLFDGLCPTCGSHVMGSKSVELSNDFKRRKDAILMEIKKRGEALNDSIRICNTQVARCQQQLGTIQDMDEQEALERYQSAESSYVKFEETDRGRQLKREIEALNESMPEVTWSDKVEGILRRKAELRKELAEQNEIYGMKASNKRVLEHLDQIALQRAETVEAQTANAKALRLIWEYERELAEIIKFRTNKMFPPRTRVIMNKYKKNGDIDFDVCQIEINGKDATATNMADRMNAGIDISTVFMQFHGLDFPLFVDGAESNTKIESYGRQLIVTMVDEKCKTITIDAK